MLDSLPLLPRVLSKKRLAVLTAVVVMATGFLNYCVFGDRADTEATVYTTLEGEVAALDGASGETQWTLPLSRTGGGSQSPFLAVHEETDRLVVADFVSEEGQSTTVLTAYRMSDGSVEFEEAVPDLIRYIFGWKWEGIEISRDGDRLFVYNYGHRNRKPNEAVRRWLSIFDLKAGEWAEREIALTGTCGGPVNFLDQFESNLYVLCGNTMRRVVVIDLESGEAKPESSSVASAAMEDGTLYTIDIHLDLHAHDLDSGLTTRISSARRMFGDDSVDPEEIGPMSVADSDTGYILVKGQEVMKVDLASGQTTGSHSFGNEVQVVQFLPHEDSAFATLEPGLLGPQLVHLDLSNGDETLLRRDYTVPLAVSVRSESPDDSGARN